MLRMNEKKIEKIVLFAVIVTLLPVYAYACYTVPLADDFCMAGSPYRVWIETESIWNVLGMAWKQSVNQYMTWTGEYICMFLQALPVGFGSFRLYFLSSWINISILFFSIYYAGKFFLVDYLKAGKEKSVIISSVILIYMLTFLPEIYDALYWHTTVVSYTLSFAIKLLVLTCMFQSLFGKEEKKGKLVWICIGAFTAGGFECSFSQTSFFLIVSAFFAVELWEFLRNGKQKKGKCWLAGLYWLLTTAGWGIALLAPGNMVRQDNRYGDTEGIVSVIWESMHRGIEGISENINLVLIVVTLLLVPLMYKTGTKSGRTFSYPALLTLFSIAVYASEYAPWIFSRGVEAPSPYGGDSGYIRNVFWMTFVVLWFVNVIYWIGWFSNVVEIRVKKTGEKKRIRRKRAYYGIVLLLLVFWSCRLEHVMEYTSPRLLWHLINGNAQRYYQAMEERETQLLKNTDEILVVPKIEMPIPTRGAGDILSDETHWVNEGVKAYYRLNCGVRTEE